jgi:hypothetical protein
MSLKKIREALGLIGAVAKGIEIRSSGDGWTRVQRVEVMVCLCEPAASLPLEKSIEFGKLGAYLDRYRTRMIVASFRGRATVLPEGLKDWERATSKARAFATSLSRRTGLPVRP